MLLCFRTCLPFEFPQISKTDWINEHLPCRSAREVQLHLMAWWTSPTFFMILGLFLDHLGRWFRGYTCFVFFIYIYSFFSPCYLVCKGYIRERDWFVTPDQEVLATWENKTHFFANMTRSETRKRFNKVIYLKYCMCRGTQREILRKRPKNNNKAWIKSFSDLGKSTLWRFSRFDIFSMYVPKCKKI